MMNYIQLIKDKYGSIPLPAKASLWYAACSVVQKCIGIIVIPIYTRLMSESDYGTYTVFQSWYAIAAMIVTLNLAAYAFQNGMMKYENDRDGFSSAMLGLSSFVTVAWIVLFLFTSEFWSSLLGLAAPIVFLLLARCLITPAYDYWSSRLRFEYRYKAVVISTLALTLLTPLVSVPAIYYSEDKIYAALICQIGVMGIVYLVPLLSILIKSRRLFNKEYWTFALRFVFPLMPYFISLTVLANVGRIIVSLLCGSEYAAIYGVASNAAMVALVLTTAVNQSLIPWTYQHIRDRRTEKIYPVLRLIVMGIVLCCVLVALFSPEIMMILAPPSYSSGAMAIPPIAATVIMMVLIDAFVRVEYYYEETAWSAIGSVIAAVVNIALTCILVTFFDFWFAGYAMLLSYGVYALLHHGFMRLALKKHNGDLYIYNVKQLFAIAFTGCVVILLPTLIFPFLEIRLFVAILLVALPIVFRKKTISVYKVLCGKNG